MTMDSSILDMFQHIKSTEHFAGAEIVVAEGEFGNTMFVVLNGHVEIRVGGKTLEDAGPGTVSGR
jgi:hypothetical protein